MIESLFNPEFMTRELAFGMNLAEFLTILAMLVMTYSTRLLGWLFLKNRRFSVRTQALLEAAPGCVMVSIAAPFFFTTNCAPLRTGGRHSRLEKVRPRLDGRSLRGYSGGAWALARLTPPSIHAAGTSEPSC